MEKFLRGITVLLTISSTVYAKRYCRNNSDCEDLGELICVRSACSWGTCGCPVGRSPRFVGSQKKFRCVTNRRVGESCSTDSEDGVCLAPNSFCDIENNHNRCKCKPGFVPAWGGETCVSVNDNTDTCNTIIPSSVSQCKADSTQPCHDPSPINRQNYMYSVLPVGPATCPCLNTHTLDFVMAHGESSFWLAPVCRPKRIGDVCLQDADCPDSGRQAGGLWASGGRCDNNKCVCETNMVPNYDKSICRLELVFDAVCSGQNDRVCNGDKGLTCGDICDLTDYYSSPPTNKKCSCGPHHITSGTTCKPIGEGDACVGDYNCRGFSRTGVCVKGVCANGVKRVTVSGALMTVMLIAIHIIRH